jgi:hypothetical protein
MCQVDRRSPPDTPEQSRGAAEHRRSEGARHLAEDVRNTSLDRPCDAQGDDEEPGAWRPYHRTLLPAEHYNGKHKSGSLRNMPQGSQKDYLFIVNNLFPGPSLIRKAHWLQSLPLLVIVSVFSLCKRMAYLGLSRWSFNAF